MTPAIPTAVSPAETRFMRSLAWGRRVVEFGALLGYSTIVLSQEAAHVVSVDRHEGYGPSTLRLYLQNLDRYRATNVQPVVGCATVVAPGVVADLAMIDLTGAYQLTRDVLVACQAPLALVHDCHRPYCQVEPAVWDAGWEPLQQVDTLLLARRR